MSRMEAIRDIVDKAISQLTDSEYRQYAKRHLYGVAEISVMLAKQHGLDVELAGTAAMMHDLYSLSTGLTKFHDQNGAEMIRPILRDMGVFSKPEQQTIISAVFHHCDKLGIHGVYDELLKDADMLYTCESNPSMPVNPDRIDRLRRLLNELGLTDNYITDQDSSEPVKTPKLRRYRKKIADIAEDLAAQSIHGSTDDLRYRLICSYWPGVNVCKELHGNWCAAFVYHCCYEARLVLPIRHPLVSSRFAGVKAWLLWSQLDETGFWIDRDDVGFKPERGDIVVYDKLLSDGPHDHIGVILKTDVDHVTVAEGNVNNESAIVRRKMMNVAGVIRIPDGYKYNARAHYYDPMVLDG